MRHQSDYMLGKVKKVEILKNEAQNRIGIFWQNLILWAESFFQRPLENFLLAWRTCSRYLKGPPNLALCVSKKIVTIRHTNERILAKNANKKKTIFGNFLWHDCSENVDFERFFAPKQFFWKLEQMVLF